MRFTVWLLLTLVVLGCSGDPEPYVYDHLLWAPTPLKPGQWVAKPALEDTSEPGWFPEMGEVRMRVAEPGEAPVAKVSALGADGEESSFLIGQDGQIWEPPAAVEKASEWDCWFGGTGHRCPCYQDTSTSIERDRYGNALVFPGRCASIDSAEISFSFIKPVGNHEELSTRSGAGLRPDVDDVTSEIENNPNSHLPSWYTLYHKTNHPTGTHGPFPSGYYSDDQYGRYTFRLPMDRAFFPEWTDIVIRKGAIVDDCSYYGSCDENDGSVSVGVTITWYALTGESTPPTLQGPNTVYPPPFVAEWRPCATCPWQQYQIIAGSIITINQAYLESQGTSTSRDAALVEHAFCHELGHSLGLSHSSSGQGSSCMSAGLNFNQQNSLTWLWGQTGSDGLIAYGLFHNANNNLNALLSGPDCGQAGGADRCRNAIRAPLGTGATGFEQ